MSRTERVKINENSDIIIARQMGRDMANEIGFGTADQTRLATAISELVRNVLQNAGSGECILTNISDEKTLGVGVIVEDHGSGIIDIEKAMKDGYSESGGLGAGLPGTKRLVSKFEIESKPGYTKVNIEIVRRRVLEQPVQSVYHANQKN